MTLSYITQAQALSSKKPRVTVRCYDLEMRPTADGLGLSLLFQAHVTNVLTKDSANAYD